MICIWNIQIYILYSSKFDSACKSITYGQKTGNETQTYLCSSTSGSDISISFLMVPSISAAKESCYTQHKHTVSQGNKSDSVCIYHYLCIYFLECSPICSQTKTHKRILVSCLRCRTHCILTTISWKYDAVQQYMV